MRKFNFALLGATAFLLMACSGGALQTGIDLSQDAGAGVVRNISAADLASLQGICTANAPVLAAATAPGVPAPVSGTAIYPAAFCKQILTGATGNANSSSLSWLPAVLTAVQDAAVVAKVVLPVVLPLL